MEFPFRLNEIFPEEISVVGPDLIPVGCPLLNQLGAKVVKERVSLLLDDMGKASAEAQSLHSIITSSDKLKNSDSKLYVFCDFTTNSAVGLLKIGKKKLFLFDNGGIQHELNPICILDFYIHESRQRKGAGKYLFEYMLRDEGIPVQHYAIDRPSDKLVFFLRRHYGLMNVLPQVNNFVVFDGFFADRADYRGKKSRWTGLDQTPDVEHLVAHRREKVGRMEDSLTYNNEPQIHLRNGHQLPLNYAQKRHNSSIGDILNPTQQVPGANGNGNGIGMRQRYINEADEDMEYSRLQYVPRRKRGSLSPTDLEIHYIMSVRRMSDANDFMKLRARSRSRDMDSIHESLW